MRPKKKGPCLILVWKLGKFDQIRKVGILGKLGKFIWKIRKVHSEDYEN